MLVGFWCCCFPCHLVRVACFPVRKEISCPAKHTYFLAVYKARARTNSNNKFFKDWGNGMWFSQWDRNGWSSPSQTVLPCASYWALKYWSRYLSMSMCFCFLLLLGGGAVSSPDRFMSSRRIEFGDQLSKRWRSCCRKNHTERSLLFVTCWFCWRGSLRTPNVSFLSLFSSILKCVDVCFPNVNNMRIFVHNT